MIVIRPEGVTFMKIELQNEDKIVVELTSSDLKTLDITYEDMDYSNIETRRVIWTLLDEARRVLGKDINTAERMLIEALPSDNGGCILYFTVLPASGCDRSSKRLIMKKEAEPILLCTEECDNFIGAVEALRKMENRYKSFNSYLLENEYYIIVYPKLTHSDYCIRCLCEYCDIIETDRTGFSKIDEYGKYLDSFSEEIDCSLSVRGCEDETACDKNVSA